MRNSLCPQEQIMLMVFYSEKETQTGSI